MFTSFLSFSLRVFSGNFLLLMQQFLTMCLAMRGHPTLGGLVLIAPMRHLHVLVQITEYRLVLAR
jgi:hypothetical protein